MSREIECFTQSKSRLVQIDDKLSQTRAKDIGSHLRVKSSEFMTEMDSGLKQLANCEEFVHSEVVLM